MHQSRHDTVRIQGEVLRLHLIELEEVDIAAAPFDSFLFQRHSASHRTYGAPKVVKLNHCHPPTRLLAFAPCFAPAAGALRRIVAAQFGIPEGGFLSPTLRSSWQVAEVWIGSNSALGRCRRDVRITQKRPPSGYRYTA